MGSVSTNMSEWFKQELVEQRTSFTKSLNEAMSAAGKYLSDLHRGANMTAEEWDQCQDPMQMVRWITQDRYGTGTGWTEHNEYMVSDRKLRLIAAYGYQINYPGSDRIRNILIWIDQGMSSKPDDLPVREIGSDSLWYLCNEEPEDAARRSMLEAYPSNDATRKCDLIREIVGNPIRPLLLGTQDLQAFDNSYVQAMAGWIYEQRKWDFMSVLADALSDHGCTYQEVLDHLWHDKDHCIGCWVLDTILGKK